MDIARVRIADPGNFFWVVALDFQKGRHYNLAQSTARAGNISHEDV